MCDLPFLYLLFFLRNKFLCLIAGLYKLFVLPETKRNYAYIHGTGNSSGFSQRFLSA